MSYSLFRTWRDSMHVLVLSGHTCVLLYLGGAYYPCTLLHAHISLLPSRVLSPLAS